jgi:acetolactate synthase I/II/III large subunit
MSVSGSEIVVRALKESGVRFLFGIPGTHNIELYDRLLDEPEMRAVLVTDEQSASFMADGVARATGQLACANIVPGAGLTHAMSGIAEAYLDQVPMLVLACGIRRDSEFAYQLHDVDQAALVRPVTKGVYQPRNHHDLDRAIREACRLAMTPPFGPTFVEVPTNLYILKGEMEREAQETPSKSPVPDLAGTIEALNRSNSIAIYAGLGALSAHDLLPQLADKLDAIVYSTLSGKGVFPETNPRWAWATLGNASPPEIRALEKNVDCLLAIGCRFGEVATASYGLTPPKELIHIDVDPNVFNRNFRATKTIQGEARDVVSALLATSLRTRTSDAARLNTLKEAHKVVRDKQLRSSSNRVAPGKLLAKLQEMCGPDAVYVTDSGNGTFLAIEHLRLQKPRSYLAPVDYSCMGYSVPAAIGAKLAAPDRPVVALVGDGALLMTGLELLTARNEKAGVLALILSDGELSQIAQFQNSALGRATCTELSGFDVKSYSAAVGAPYFELSNEGQMSEVLENALKLTREGVAVVVNVAIDYSESTYFSKGVIKTNFHRLPVKDRLRFAGRVIKRKIF